MGLRYTRRNAMTREQYALRPLSEPEMVEAGEGQARNSPAERLDRTTRRPQAEPEWRPIAAPMSGPTVGL